MTIIATKALMQAQIDTLFADSTTGTLTESNLRSVNQDLVDTAEWRWTDTTTSPEYNNGDVVDAQITSLLADNTAGNISPTDETDVLTGISDVVFRLQAPPPISFVASSQKQSSVPIGKLRITPPAGNAFGDLVLLFGQSRDSLFDASGLDPAFTELAAYTVDTSSVSTPPTTNSTWYMWWKIISDRAGDTDRYNFVMSDEGANAAAIVMCAVFRNATSVRSFAITGGSASAPTVTAETGDALVSFHGTCTDVDDDTNIVQPSGMTIMETEYNATADVGCSMAYELGIAAGATGAKTWATDWDNFEASVNILLIQNDD